MNGKRAHQCIVRKYNVLPVSLYRIQGRLPIRLLDYDSQMAKGRRRYDVKLCKETGKVLPAEGDKFIGPNGAILRPLSNTLVRALVRRNKEPIVFCLREGMQLPDDLVMIHERGDYYSLQTTVPIELSELNDKITKIMEEAPRQTREQFLAYCSNVDNQDN